MALSKFRLLAAVTVFSLTLSGCSVLDGELGKVLEIGGGPNGALDERTVAAGIKEALRVGSDRTVESTSRRGGFLENRLIHIAIPEQLLKPAGIMRDFGMGNLVDELESGMNRAAELAAAEAKQVLWNAITEMTVQDAFGILRGGDNAATEYFRRKTGPVLRKRFHPIVESKIESIGLSRVYNRFADAYNIIDIEGKPELVELDEYVTSRALDGLFTVLGREELKIREDPVARTTELLRRVFGQDEAQSPG
ncbi:MAG: DUF4197 domain-containing protein [Candidatus Krumholzibacteriota bacterium]|nr:DUF4197 domain-containing protein [Candidatus Krumholzibacteriota bacterium]